MKTEIEREILKRVIHKFEEIAEKTEDVEIYAYNIMIRGWLAELYELRGFRFTAEEMLEHIGRFKE